MTTLDDEDELLRSVALQNATSILLARQRAEEELLRTQEALRESQERLQAALGAAGTGTFRWDIGTDIVEWDGNLGRLLGLSADRTRAPLETFFGAVHPDDRATVLDAFARAARDGSEVDLEFRVLSSDGTVHWISGKGRAFFDEAGRPLYVTGACADVTSRNAAAEEREALLESERAARTAAERLSEVKDEFLATLSHELRTPLNAILGWSQVLRSGTRSQAELAKGLETIERNARAQTQLIDDLLDMSRITSGKLRLNIQSVSPVTVIEAAIETVQPAAEAKGLRLERLLDPAAGPISGDPGRLQQVVWNLLSNAIKFTPRGGRVQVLLERVNSHVEISVADTGAGVRPEFLPFLFDRFRQGDASTTRTHGGLGLGLSIVKSIVELHGGSVRADSRGEGQGTTVTVQLPITVVYRREDLSNRVHPTASPTIPPTFMAADLSGVRVLVVDDRSDARDLVRRVLEECAAHVLTAATADEAIQLIEAVKPDVLVSDIGMPDVDGFELLRRVRALGQERGGRVPAIALTAFARSEDRTRALRAGFLVHVSKPVDPSELVAAVASVSGRAGT